MSIDAKQLRIGNYYFDRQMNREFIVQELRKFCINHGDDDYSPSRYDLCEGIPLTSDWLERAGFKDCEDEDFNIYNDAKMYFNKSIQIGSHRIRNVNHPVKNPTCFHGYPINAVNYVHELQNLFRVLTGEELTFTPKQ